MRIPKRWLLFGTTLAAAVLRANAQAPVINSFDQKGLLTATNLVAGSIASVEWASSVSGPWHTNWAGLDTVTVSSNGTIQVNVPTFYRVRGVAATNSSAPPGMAWIPPGTFFMGSPANENERSTDETQHSVTLTKGFYMAKNLVTQGQYIAVVGSNPSSFVGNVNRPVENVSWYDATNYCAKLTAAEQVAGRLPVGWVYRLPTEAEWEYACRAGTKTAFNVGPDLRSGMANFDATREYIGTTGSVTNSIGVALRMTTAVGSYPPNAWGLYDMHGNLGEWCWDWYGAYPIGSVIDPGGPSSGSYRLVRGGSFGSFATNCRSARRFIIEPGVIRDDIGFRPVLAPVQ